MHPGDSAIDDFLASVLRGEDVRWPEVWDQEQDADAVGRAAIVHGAAGLLADRASALEAWPPRLAEMLRDEARAQAMWELRHREIIARLIAALDKEAIPSLVLKGTAIAYDLYDNPSARSRGDTDLLVAVGQVARAEAVLANLGFAGEALGGVTREFALQQTWTLTLPDGGSHSVDLHWQVMNAPSLAGLLIADQCFANARPLPRLSALARAIDRVRLLIHTCLHRALQNNAPYFVGGRAYHEPNRLIWLQDIHLIAAALGEAEWTTFCSLVKGMRVSGPCLDGLRTAQAKLGTAFPAWVARDLAETAARERPSHYFARSHALSRGWQDFRSIPGASAKVRYILSRLGTTEPFLRAKYPGMARRPLALLYGRRLLDLLRGRVRKAAP